MICYLNLLPSSRTGTAPPAGSVLSPAVAALGLLSPALAALVGCRGARSARRRRAAHAGCRGIADSGAGRAGGAEAGGAAEGGSGGPAGGGGGDADAADGAGPAHSRPAPPTSPRTGRAGNADVAADRAEAGGAALVGCRGAVGGLPAVAALPTRNESAMCICVSSSALVTSSRAESRGLVGLLKPPGHGYASRGSCTSHYDAHSSQEILGGARAVHTCPARPMRKRERAASALKRLGWQ